MSLSAIADSCKDLKIYEQRYNSEDYKEWVIYSVDLPKWQQKLEERLGSARKPPGKEPSREHLHMTENYGGIYRHQTLFKGEDNSCQVIVMFWPWQDNKHITLKMAVCQ